MCVCVWGGGGGLGDCVEGGGWKEWYGVVWGGGGVCVCGGGDAEG